MRCLDVLYARPGLEKARKVFQQENKLVLIAPTGYGKTVLSLRLYKDLVEEGPWAGLIHVAPFRALVRQIYLEKFKQYVPDSGYQSLDRFDLHDKSPYFLKKLVITTLDSFVYNLYKIPVAELNKVYREVSLGHYYPVLLSIFTSIVVFDEAHVYLGDYDESVSINAVAAATKFLHEAEAPVLIETATMHSSLVAEISKSILGGSKVLYVGCENVQVKKLRERGVEVEVVRDDDFSSRNTFKWHTVLTSGDKLINVVREYCESNLVLVIVNTVKRAVKLYDEITSKGLCSKAVLLHGLLSSRDREEAVKILEDMQRARKGVVVSTQVVEAGVEVPARILVTDVAPIENLAQRAGRLCREKYSSIFEECRSEGPLVYIVEPGSEQELEEIAGPYSRKRVESALAQVKKVIENQRKIDWRLLCNHDNYVSFAELLEEVEPVGSVLPRTPAQAVLSRYLESDATPETLIELMKMFNLELTRTGYLISLLVNAKEVCSREIEDLSELEVVVVDLDRLLREKEKGTMCVETATTEKGEYLRLAVVSPADRGRLRVYCDAVSMIPLPVRRPSLSLTQYAKLTTPQDPVLRKQSILALPIAVSECYVRGRGFMVWR